MRRGSTSKFYHGDALGSTRGITNASQTVTDSVLYDGIGMVVSRTGTTPTPFGFVGKGQYQTDNDSGLQLLGHRYYDASVGRFISSDPIQDGDNWYAYCDNSPLKTTDPLGLKPPHDVAWHWVHDSDPDPPTKHQDDGRLKKIGQATWGFMSAVGSALAAFGEYASGQSGPMDGDIDRLGQGNEGAGNNSGWDPNRTHRDDLPKGKSGEPIADPNAQGPHTVIGTRTNPKESPAPYRQGVSYGPEGKPIGRTDVSNHGRPGDHSPVHFHPWNGRKFTNPSIPIQKNR